jgi:hypothetical protein
VNTKKRVGGMRNLSNRSDGIANVFVGLCLEVGYRADRTSSRANNPNEHQIIRHVSLLVVVLVTPYFQHHVLSDYASIGLGKGRDQTGFRSSRFIS